MHSSRSKHFVFSQVETDMFPQLKTSMVKNLQVPFPHIRSLVSQDCYVRNTEIRQFFVFRLQRSAFRNRGSIKMEITWWHRGTYKISCRHQSSDAQARATTQDAGSRVTTKSKLVSLGISIRAYLYMYMCAKGENRNINLGDSINASRHPPCNLRLPFRSARRGNALVSNTVSAS